MKNNTGFLMKIMMAALALPLAVCASTPLTAVHPSWTKYDLRPTASFRPEVGGIAFLSDGRLVVGAWQGTRAACCPSSYIGNRQFTGKVYVLSHVTGTSPAVTIDTIATGLEDIMGLTVVHDTIYVSGGNVIVRIINPGNAGPSTRIDTVFILPGTPMAGTGGDSLKPVKGRSEWLYGLLARNDTLFVAPSSMYNGDTKQVNPYRGRILAVNPGNGTTNKRGSFTTYAVGFRHPTGLTFGPDGSIWTTETQGQWNPTNKLTYVKRGGYFGYRHDPGTGTNITVDQDWNTLTETPAAVFLPQEANSNRAAAVFSGSPGAPYYLTSGPYAGQFLMGDLEWGGIQRYSVEVVNGAYQGAGFVWMGGLESGVYRMATGPDSMLYLGMIGASDDWNWNGQLYGLQKLAYNGTPSFEMHAVHSRAQGMEIEFNMPVDTVSAKVASNYTIQTYYYQPTASYGGTKATGSLTTLTPGAIQISPDRKRVYLPLTGLVARTGTQQRIVEITLSSAVKSAGNVSSQNTKAYYTLNAISPSQPFDTTAGSVVPVDREMLSRRLSEGLMWAARGDQLSIRSAFRGAYELTLVDPRGVVLASASGRGPGTQNLRIANLRGRFAILRARGDGITLSKTMMLP